MHDTLHESQLLVAALRKRIGGLELIIEQRDATLRRCEAVILKLRDRVGDGFRGEVRAFSDSIKDLLK
jgi:hypothetical protein